MHRDKKSRTKQKKRRRLIIESLESRQLLAVDGIRIDLGGSGGTDLLGPNGGGSVQQGYLSGPIGLTLNTSNVPGQNNELPVAGPDSHVMGQNDPAVDFLFARLISNDSDPDSAGPLVVTGIDATNTRGHVTFDAANNKVNYDPNGQMNFVAEGQTGTDTFKYTVTDPKGGVGTGVVTITIHGANDAPSFTPGADVTVDEDSGPQTVAGWATNITDGDSETDGLVFEITNNTNPSLFSVAPAIDAAGNLSFTPAEDVFGDADLSVRIDDGQGSDQLSTVATFKITVNSVNDAPSFTPGADVTVDEDSGPQTVTGWATNITDGDSETDGLVFELTNNTNPSLFSVAPAIDAAGNLSFTPADDAFGDADLSVRIDDGQGSDHLSTVATFKITVNSVNDAPSFTAGADVAVDEDSGPQTVTGWATNITDGDSETDGLVFEITNNTNPSLFSVVPAIDAAGNLSFTPADDAFGDAALSVRIDDGQGTDHLSTVATFKIIVNSVNDAPTFELIATLSADIHDGTHTASTIVSSVAPGPDNESGQSVDVVIGFNSNPDLFQIQPSLDNSGDLTFTPAATGTATLTFQAMDNGGINHGGMDTAIKQLVITINEANRAPTLDPIDVSSGDEGVPIVFTANAFDINGDSLDYSLVGAPDGATISSNGDFSWTPSETQGGATYTFDVQVTDGELSDTKQLTISIAEVNEAPVLDPVGVLVVAEGQSFRFTATATDVDFPQDEKTFGLSGDVPDGATMGSDGNFQWTPTADQFPGTYTFDVQVSDGALSDSETITISLETSMQNKYPIDGNVDFTGLQTLTESLNFDVSGTTSLVTIGFDNDDRSLYVALEWADASFDNQWYLEEVFKYDEVVLQIDANGNNLIDPGEDYRWVRATNSGSFFRDAYFNGLQEQDDIVGDGLAKIRYDSVEKKYQAELMIPLADDINEQDSTITASSRFQLIIRDGYQPYEDSLNQSIVFAGTDLPLIPVKQPVTLYDHPTMPTDLTGLIVYVSTHEDPNGEIYTFDPATGTTFRVTNNTLAENAVSLSRDRTKIAFHAFTNSELGPDPTEVEREAYARSLEIFTINVDGTQLQQVTGDSNANAHPAWSPDGTKLSYSPIFPDSPGITIISESGEFIQNLTPEGIIDHDADYLPDGRIVFKTNRWSSSPQYLTGVMNDDGTNVQQLTFVSNVSDHDPFGNGQAVIFERFVKGTDYEIDPEGLTLGWDLIEVPLDGSGEITLLSDGWMNTVPVYDPSGEYVLYMKGPAYFEASLMTRTGKVLGRFIPDVTQIRFIDWR